MLFTFPSIVLAQLTFADSSRLKDPRYLEDRVKNISDEDLFTSINLQKADRGSIRVAVEKKDFRHAYEEWARYWGSKEQPTYITQNYQLLIDTDLLKMYNEMRGYVNAHPAEKDSILRAADKVLRHEIRMHKCVARV